MYRYICRLFISVYLGTYDPSRLSVYLGTYDPALPHTPHPHTAPYPYLYKDSYIDASFSTKLPCIVLSLKGNNCDCAGVHESPQKKHLALPDFHKHQTTTLQHVHSSSPPVQC